MHDSVFYINIAFTVYLAVLNRLSLKVTFTFYFTLVFGNKVFIDYHIATTNQFTSLYITSDMNITFSFYFKTFCYITFNKNTTFEVNITGIKIYISFDLINSYYIYFIL